MFYLYWVLKLFAELLNCDNSISSCGCDVPLSDQRTSSANYIVVDEDIGRSYRIGRSYWISTLKNKGESGALRNPTGYLFLLANFERPGSS